MACQPEMTFVQDLCSQLKNKRVLVTGATGFIGGRVVERLCAETGAEVRAILRYFYKAPRIACCPVQMISGDLATAADVQRAVEGCSIVVHTAWDFGGADGAAAARERNLAGLRHLLDAAHAHHVERFVHISTAAVFDHREARVITEEAPRRTPPGDYASTKTEAEAMIREYMARGLPAVILEPTIVYGPWSATWTMTPLKRMRKGDMVIDEGEGRCTPVYIDDLVSVILQACVDPAAVGETFLVGGPESMRWQDFYGAYARMLGVRGVVPMSAVEAEQPAPAWSGLRERARRIPGLVRMYRFLKFEVGRAAGGTAAAETATPRGAAAGGQASRTTIKASPAMLDLYRCQARVSSAKAGARLGYVPAFNLARGMALTEQWARWMKFLDEAPPSQKAA